ncbi:MAG: hypothetical protein ACE5DN_06560 [Flavobacteriales bacterium]
MRKLAAFLLLTVSTCCASGQDTALRLIKSIPVKADFFTTDQLGNIYLIKGTDITKYDIINGSERVFSNKLMGRITSVDASDPLKIILFYSDLSQLVFLDNMMSMVGNPLTLETRGLEQVTLAAGSHDNGLWLYDRNTFQLLRLNRDMEKTQETGDLRQMLRMDMRPNLLTEHNNHLYLNNPDVGILVFDIFGTYYKTIPLAGLKEFQIHDHSIYYLQDNKFCVFDMITLEKQTLPLPVKHFQQVRIEKQRIYLLGDDALSIYSFKE